jgi:hypothetical protein
MNHRTLLSSSWRSPLGIFMLVAGAVGLYYLMHFFHGHGGHGHGNHGAERPRDIPSKE